MTQVRRTRDEIVLEQVIDLLRSITPRRLLLRNGEITNPYLEAARREFYRLEDGLGEPQHHPTPQQETEEIDMAERLEGPYDFSKHDFSRYADGATWVLTAEEDFAIKPNSLLAAARAWARKEGLEVEYKVIEGEPEKQPDKVAIRFTRKVHEIRSADQQTG